MNRFQRRAQEAIERKGNGGGMRPNQSFQDLVSQANREALKPFIIDCMSELEQLIRRDLARQYIEALAPVQTRLMVLEKLAMEKLGETNESLAERVLAVEDEATGHTATQEPAEKGDLLRITSQLRLEGQEKWSRPMNIILRALATAMPNPETGQPSYQTYEALEDALVGAKVGETREVEVSIPNGESTVKYTFKATVNRVSRNEQQRAREAAMAKAAAEKAAAQASEPAATPEATPNG